MSELLQPLDHDEQISLQEDEAIISRGLQTFYEVGAALARIRDARKYRAAHATFEDYCQARWGMNRAHAYRLTEAAEVMAHLSPIGYKIPLPANEAQTRPLAQLPADEQPAAWQRATEIAAEEGKPVVARHVTQAVAERNDATEETHYHERMQSNAEAWETMVAPPVAPEPVATPPAPMAVHFSSATPEWHTPAHIVNKVVELFGHIDLDPCSNAHGEAANVPAQFHFTRDDDGLAQSWRTAPYTDTYGDESRAVRVYMNPPYGDEIGPWVRRLVAAYTTGEITEAVALLPARVDTAWFQPLYDHTLCFVRGRLRFVGADAGAPFPSVVVYLGADATLFREIFADVGPLGRLV